MCIMRNMLASGFGSSSPLPPVGTECSPPPELEYLLSRYPSKLLGSIPKCGGCQQLILDRFILKAVERTWHARCLKCSECGAQLADKCFARQGLVFCKEDFFKKYGTKCAGCHLGIPPSQVVRRAQDYVYHLQCFSCVLCGRQLNTGDEFYLMEDRKLVCKPDYEAAKAKEGGCLEGDQPNKRPRTTITAKQLETLKMAYNNSPKPARHVREQLSQDTGLDMRVVQVWFQNRRAKEKRLKKDAGRTRWSQYFRNMKSTSGSSPTHGGSGGGGASTKSEHDLDNSTPGYPHSHELESNDSYGGGALSIGEEGGSPGGGGRYIQSGASPSYMHSPPQPSMPAHYTPEHHPYSHLGGGEMSDSGSRHGYPEFPPSPDSWLGEQNHRY